MKKYTCVMENQKEEFYKWFVGFSDAEASFSIVPKYKTDKLINSFSFVFAIRLHIDDIEVLKFIKNNLNIGNIRISGNECIFSVTNKEGVLLLIQIFETYKLNTTKYLDYVNFKNAFNLYNSRDGLSEKLINQILNLKNTMNTHRTDFTMSSKIEISKSWLLGFIEGDGSFNIWRNDTLPVFSIALSETQKFLLLKIKEFLINNLGFDKYSKYKLDNSSIISVNTQKARNNSKASTSLVIKNIHVLYNYLIPYFEGLIFNSKKGKDYEDFKIICKAIYFGAHKNEEIKELILKLSKTMNNYRLSTFSGIVETLSKKEREILINITPLIEYLKDGRQKDVITKKIIHQHTSSIYEINVPNKNLILVLTLSEAAKIVGVETSTLSKQLENMTPANIKGYNIIRIPIFYKE